MFRLPWFKRKGIIFIPESSMGWLILAGGIILAVYFFIEIDHRSDSASDTLRPFFICLLGITAVYSLVAFLTSDRQ